MNTSLNTFRLEMKVNGQLVSLDIPPTLRLIDVLRDELRLTGTKEGCGEGECGACSVLLDGKLVNSCLILAPQAHGKEVITIEGLAAQGELHILQKSFAEAGAIQCGFCTPGMILAAKALLDSNPCPTREEIALAISGNLCRCTGYVKIIEAIELAARRLREEKVQEAC
ncbi:purine hydroxylase delta subunit apoprotein [Thermanaeromonas toyohensis ToBE]|uniref:Purine hydroxylase delta subunit apoprotein n=1 Tax=Thermanaeromonas toyohensis ToBE TaxID=698762 RepID=A0A1W1VJ43_9FIRM|nr:(2Fe-2S)-binding protein [Thermanaeromonas toyohensis]SMB93348.1 purine hydroxylase delta subunit apoprotein [Thermanaeromonas toyohensis ToBE]